MATRTIITDELGELITTENGVATTTRSVMNIAAPSFDWRTTFDPDSGVNKELMQYTLDQITDHRDWWNQGVWRDFTALWGQPRSEEHLASVLPYDALEPACGTAMCTAGWVVETTRPDWVIDAATFKALTKAKLHRLVDRYEDSVLVRYDDVLYPEFTTPKDTAWTWESTYDDELIELLKARGFSGTTHHVEAISNYAARCLGIGSDPFSLFDGDNSYERVLETITEYAGLQVKPDDLDSREIYDRIDAIRRRAGESPGEDDE